jgi:hypothetical protein
LGHLFYLKFPNFDQICLWAKVLIYYGSIFGDIWTKLGAFFSQTSGHTDLCFAALFALSAAALIEFCVKNPAQGYNVFF